MIVPHLVDHLVSVVVPFALLWVVEHRELFKCRLCVFPVNYFSCTIRIWRIVTPRCNFPLLYLLIKHLLLLFVKLLQITTDRRHFTLVSELTGPRRRIISKRRKVTRLFWHTVLLTVSLLHLSMTYGNN